MGFEFKFSLPSPEHPADVASRELLVNGAAVAIEPVTAPATDWVGPFAEDESFTLQLQDYDAKGNPTPGDAQTFTAVDDIGPAKPGAIGIMEKRQVQDAPAEPPSETAPEPGEAATDVEVDEPTDVHEPADGE